MEKTHPGELVKRQNGLAQPESLPLKKRVQTLFGKRGINLRTPTHAFPKLLFSLSAIALFCSVTLEASDWTGANSTWSSNANPGWNGTGVPNALGAVANHGVSTTTVTTQDIAAGVTVGTISLTNNSNNSWSFTLTNSLTLNQDGAGAGFATISNSNTTAGTTNFLSIGSAGSGTITLADDLLITNTGASTNTTGSIQIAGKVGGTGNITLSNTLNDTTAGVIRFVTGVNTFTGTVLVQKGATTFNKAESFGNVSSNTITIGQSGQGSATLVSTAGVVLPNNIVVAASSGGTLVFGSTSTVSPGYSGTIMLNGDISITSASTGANNLTLSNTISGDGNMTKIGGGAMALTAANNFNGTTTVSNGTLKAAAVSGAALANTSGITVNTGGTLLLGAANQINDSATMKLAGGTFNTGGLSEGTATSAGIGALTLSASSIIDMGSGSSVVAFADSSAATWSGTLSIWNWSGNAISGGGTDQLYFSTNSSGLTPTQLGEIVFYSNAGTTQIGYGAAQLLSDGELVPVPEPTTIIGAMLAVGLVGWREPPRLAVLIGGSRSMESGSME